MKKFRLLLTLATVLFCLQGGFAQVHVTANQDVGIGATGTDNAKLRIVNSTNVVGLRTYMSNTTTTNSIYGLYNFLDSGGSSPKTGFYNYVRQNASTSQQTRGIQNQIYPYGTGTGYGILNYMYNQGTGQKIGAYNYVYQNGSASQYAYGSQNYIRNYGTGGSYGYYSAIYQTGNGLKVGNYNYIRQASTSSQYIKGFYAYSRNEGTGFTYGFENYMHVDGTGPKYGFQSRVYQNTSSSSPVACINSTVYADGGGTGYGIYNRVNDASTSSGTKYGIYNYLENDGSGTRYAFWSGVQGAGNWAGYFSGNVYVTGTLTEAGSDARLKNEIKDLSGSLDILNQLAPKTYTFKKDAGLELPDGQQYGLIAQDLEKVLPTLVSDVQHPGKPIYEKKRTKETVLVPEDENDTKERTAEDLGEDVDPVQVIEQEEEMEEEVIVGYEDGQTFKTVNYKGLIPILVGAVKEQQALIDSQQKQLQQQQVQIDQLIKAMKK